jgi:hypothetical protein
VQKRWINLRTCFRRELNAQKNTKSGQAAIKRRRYVYFENLLFLLPCIGNRQTEGNLEEDDSLNDEDDDESGPSTSTPIPPRKKRTNVPKRTDVDEALLKALNETNNEDTNFALSLVSLLQNLTAEEKLDAKIIILNVFKQIRLARPGKTTSQSSSSCNTNIWPPPQSLLINAYTTSSTPSPNMPFVQNISSPDTSNETARSYVSNFSDDSELNEF